MAAKGSGYRVFFKNSTDKKIDLIKVNLYTRKRSEIYTLKVKKIKPQMMKFISYKSLYKIKEDGTVAPYALTFIYNDIEYEINDYPNPHPGAILIEIKAIDSDGKLEWTLDENNDFD